MKRLLRYIRQHLSLHLGLIITLIIAIAFSLLFDVLFERCKQFIQRAVIDHATQLLDNTAERINGIMDDTELVTNFVAITSKDKMKPENVSYNEFGARLNNRKVTLQERRLGSC